jgi:ribosomal protein S21
LKRAKTLEEYESPQGLLRSRRPAHAVVVVDGDVEAALKTFKHRRTDSGFTSLFKRTSPLFGYLKPGERRRRKSAIARARIRRFEVKRAKWEARREPPSGRGARARRPAGLLSPT